MSVLHCRSQTSLTSEKQELSLGQSRTVYVVLKNAPFKIDFAFDGALPDALRQDTPVVRTVLLYDQVTHDASASGGTGEREVHYISQPPMSSKVVKAGEQDEVIRVECRLRVLTSQHEHNYFRVKLTVEGAKGGESWSAESGPIRVISKPETNAGRKKGVKRDRPVETSSSACPPPPPPPSSSSLSSSFSNRSSRSGSGRLQAGEEGELSSLPSAALLVDKLDRILANQASMMDGAVVASSLAGLSGHSTDGSNSNSSRPSNTLSDHLRDAALAISRLRSEEERVSKVREAADSSHSPTIVAQLQALATAIMSAVGGGAADSQGGGHARSEGQPQAPPEPKLTSSGALSDDVSMYQMPKVCECPSCPAVRRLNDIETLYNTFSM